MVSADIESNRSLIGSFFLVTGGSGFFGDFFLATVLARGAKVINVDIVPSKR